MGAITSARTWSDLAIVLVTVSDFFDSCEANAYGGFIRNCFSLRNNFLTG